MQPDLIPGQYGTQLGGEQAVVQHQRVLRNTYFLLALSLIPTGIGALIGVGLPIIPNVEHGLKFTTKGWMLLSIWSVILVAGAIWAGMVQRRYRCPKCGAHVYELDMAYSCEKALGPEKTCDFRSGKVILQRPIEREQMVKLLSTGRTDLLSKFISKKGRPFQAFLVKGPDGAVRFEFAPRAAKVPKVQPAPSASGEGTDSVDAGASNQIRPSTPARKASRKKTDPGSSPETTASVKGTTGKKSEASGEKLSAKKAVTRKKKAKAAK